MLLQAISRALLGMLGANLEYITINRQNHRQKCSAQGPFAIAPVKMNCFAFTTSAIAGARFTSRSLKALGWFTMNSSATVCNPRVELAWHLSLATSEQHNRLPYCLEELGSSSRGTGPSFVRVSAISGRYFALEFER